MRPTSLALALTLTGCVTVYQPLSGLHRPVAVDTRAPNLAGVAVTLRCLPGPTLSGTEAADLCRKLTRLLERQGAQVQALTHRRAPEAPEPPAEGEAPTATPALALAERLEVELTARRIHEESTSFLFWDYISDYSFAQEVVIRDGRGFLLARETLTGRFMDRLGFGGDAETQFSQDFYGQLSQIALNARIRQRVLGEASGGP